MNVTVTVNPLPVVSITGSNIICDASPITVTATDITGGSYQWYKDGAPIASATNRTLSISDAGDYKVEVTTTATGCVGEATKTMTKPPLFTVTPITADKDISATCIKETITLTANHTAVTPPPDYQWQKENGGGTFVDISGATNKTYTTTTAWKYRVLFNKGSPCQKEAGAVRVNFAPLPIYRRYQYWLSRFKLVEILL